MMGSRTKNTPSKTSTAKKIKEIVERMEANEINFFHSALRSESMINLLIEKGVITQEEMQKEITRLVHISQNISLEEQLTEVEVNNKDKTDNVDIPDLIESELKTSTKVDPELKIEVKE